jgi:tetratricopeptide (TPR) repeat protein
MNAGNITLLKLADKLVREGHYAQALGAILKARQEDPANRYAEAYEERVRALLPTQQTDLDPKKNQAPESQAETSLFASIEDIVALLGRANEALSCNDFPGALELIGQARLLDPEDVDIKALEEHVRTTCNDAPLDMTPGHEQEIIRGTIRAYEDEVYELAGLGEYEEAKELLARALMLDPADNDLRACERLIHAAAKVDRQHAEVYTLAANAVQRIDPDPSPGSESRTATEADPAPNFASVADAYRVPDVQYVTDTPPAPDITSATDASPVLAPDPAEKPGAAPHVQPAAAKGPVAGISRTAARRAELNQHLNAAHVLCNGGAYDEALTEIALGYIIDPMDERLHALEESVWTAKATGTATDELPRSSDDCDRRVRLQILAAEEFARSGEFTRALDGLAKAYVIDPSNNELKRAEVRIRQQEIRHHQSMAQPLTLVYHHERVANAE